MYILSLFQLELTVLPVKFDFLTLSTIFLLSRVDVNSATICLYWFEIFE